MCCCPSIPHVGSVRTRSHRRPPLHSNEQLEELEEAKAEAAAARELLQALGGSCPVQIASLPMDLTPPVRAVTEPFLKTATRSTAGTVSQPSSLYSICEARTFGADGMCCTL